MTTLTFARATLFAALIAGCTTDESPELSEEATAYGAQLPPNLPPLSESTANIVKNVVGDPVENGKRRYFGVSVAVIRDGVRSLHHFGQAVDGTNVRPNGDTLYAIGSVTKTMTATLLALMDRENTAKLSDNFDYLYRPEYAIPTVRRPITLENLATMHSGLQTSAPGGELAYREGSYADDMEKLRKTLEVCPASGCQGPVPATSDGDYSNYGFAILGDALARQSGYTTFQGALQNKILYPLDMFRTNNKANLTDASCVIGSCTYDDYGACLYRASCNQTFSPNAAAGYHKLDNGTWQREASPGSNDNIKASSGVLWSTPNDMLKWLAFNLGLSTNTTLNAARQKVHVVRTSDNMGLGWQRVEMPYGNIWKKSGALPEEAGAVTASFTAYIAFIEGSNDGVIVMANSSGAGGMALDILKKLAD